MDLNATSVIFTPSTIRITTLAESVSIKDGAELFSTSPTELYRPCQDNKYVAEFCSTSPNVLYKSNNVDACSTSPYNHNGLYRPCQDTRNDLVHIHPVCAPSQNNHNGLYISCNENTYTTGICSASPDHHPELNRSYGELYVSCDENTQQSSTIFDNHIDVYSSCQEIPTTFHIAHSGSRGARYQDLTPANALDKQRILMNQVQMPIASMRLELQRYQDILFGIKDGIVQVGTSIKDDPLAIKKKVRRNKITKYHKFRRALASSENLMRLNDGEAISTWDMGEWLVVEKV